MIMKRLFILSSIFLIIGEISSQQITYSKAQKVARNFFSKQQKSATTCSYIAKDKQDTLFYVFNAEKGFVVIAADKRSVPILAFSDKDVFEVENVTPPVKMWLEHYENQIRLLQSSSEGISEKNIQSWSKLLKNQKDFDNDIEFISPLLTSKWGQGKNYNYFCPKDETGPNGRVVTGCVATAIAQLIYYFRFPTTGIGAYSYEHDTYGTIAADFSAATYDYAAMTDIPNGINTAMSLLIHHCGVAVDMVYGPKASAMYNHKAAYVLRTYFKYAPETEYVFRDTTTQNWDSIIVSHLNRKIPLYYAGWSIPDTNGHGFICDGYQRVDSNYYYHFNFGWDGYMDGYFYTDALSPGGNNFNLAQEIIINAYPDTSLYTYPDPKTIVGETIFTEAAGSFEDGSGRIHNYANNMDYTWKIFPDLDSIQKINFYIQYQIAENDTLFITSNDNNNENIIITNDSANMNLEITGTKIIVRLVSHDGPSKNGFYAYYSITIPSYCNPLQIITAKSGKIEDGSGNKRYNNFTECKKHLKINGVTCITLNFTKFETEKDKDILYIYDYGPSEKELLLSLSGNIGDTSFTFNTNFLFFIFKTDEKNVFDGWELNYTSGMIGVYDNTAIENQVILYPNPVTNQLVIDLAQYKVNNIIIYDYMGKQIKNHCTNTSDIVIDVSDLAKGMYLISINTDKGNITKKFIKQ